MYNAMQEFYSSVKLILLRHGESAWNRSNVFTGWVDIPLSPKGIEEAFEAGEQIKDIPIDVIFTSTLARAQMTTFLAMSRHSTSKIPVVQHPGEGRMDTWATIYGKEAQENVIPVYYSWELNERMYGELQGCNKAETAQKFGAEQVQIWRRSYDVAPPNGESLAMTAARSLPYFDEQVKPHLEADRNVLICAHGNSLRAICMELDSLTKEQVLKSEIPTGVPIIYTYSKGTFTKACGTVST